VAHTTTRCLNADYWNEHALLEAGIAQCGYKVRVATTCTLVGLEHMAFGDNVQIDAYCSLIASGPTAGLTIGSFVHIGGYTLLGAGAGVGIESHCTLSQGVRIYSRSADFSGEHLPSPLVPPEYSGIEAGRVRLQRHVLLGSGVVVLPGVDLGAGVAVGALSLVRENLPPWTIWAGVPARPLREREQGLLDDLMALQTALDAPVTLDTPHSLRRLLPPWITDPCLP